jgi:hypothetical protein
VSATVAAAATLPRETENVALELAARLVAGLEAPGGEARLVGRREFRWSEHLLFDLRRDPAASAERVLVKRVKVRDRRGRRQTPAGDPHARSVAEHAALVTLHRLFDSTPPDGLTAIRPRACYPDLDALAMDYRPGVHLLHIIARATRPFSRAPERPVLDAAHHGGRWLGFVHRALARSGQDGSLDGRMYAQTVSVEMRRLSSAMTRRVRFALESRWIPIQDRLTATNLQTLPLHGDFYPENVVVADAGGVFAVDTTLNTRGPGEDDVARFLVGVDTLKPRLLAGDLAVQSHAVERIKRAFVDGYRTMRPASATVLEAAVVRAYLVRWSELRSVAALNYPTAVVSVLRGRIDAFMASRLIRFLHDPDSVRGPAA